MNAESELAAAEELVRHARAEWRRYENQAAAMSLPTMRSASMDGRVSSSGHSDPTVSQVEAHQPYFETAALVSELLGIAREIVKRQTNARSRTIDISAEVDAARCDGVVGEDPTCTRNAVRDPTFQGAKHPTCWRCLKRAQRRDEQAEAS